MTAYEIFAFVAATVLAQSPLVFGGSYQTACVNPSCPSVTWLDAAAGQVTNFTLQSSLQTSVNKYVAFAFATGQTMGSALLVVDCYDVQGSAMIGTSRNAMVGHQNVASPGDLSSLSNRNAIRNQNLLTCTFSMALPNSSAFILISEGAMDVSATPAVKTRHTGRYPSTATFSFIAPTTKSGAMSTMSSAPTTKLGAIYTTPLIYLRSKNKATVPGIRFDVIVLACVIASSWMFITLNQGA